MKLQQTRRSGRLRLRLFGRLRVQQRLRQASARTADKGRYLLQLHTEMVLT
ncbi:MAG: hypothetical protein F6J93_13625 [Oscillatoria sp. SIO1A7]|nr:hypothetical protein [Oscillatoria sp. SIO1A7]